MQNTDNVKLEAPSLPSGGGAISGLKGDIAGAGPDGAAALTLPLPVTAGRGYAPALALNYHSRNGNGQFGMGWGVSVPAVRRRTRKGVPAFDDTDEFTGPDGEVLVPSLTAGGTPDIRSATALLGKEPGGRFRVHAYRSRLETDFSHLEHWVPEDEGTDFWVIYSPDGQVHLTGRSADARISHPQHPAQIAVWLLESSVSATGEQMYYQYRGEDEKECDVAEVAAHPDAVAQRYLVAVWYGNKIAGRTLPGLITPPVTSDWLFTLVLDYGERNTSADSPPDWLAPGTGNWPCRADAFTSREYGFALRTRRLCRQVLMYHAITALAGKEQAGDAPQLVARLLLTYHEDPSASTLRAVQQVAYEPDGTLRTLPPVTLSWQTFSLPTDGGEWQRRDDMGKLNHHHPYQLVDLNGEGMAGILYQDTGAWWYRAPARDTHGDKDAVTWAPPSPLPAVPALRDGGLLTDLDGDGYLEWVVTAPGRAGLYGRTAEREWQHFSPLSALPVEYAHPRAVQADLAGAGLTDIMLIGPKSVRLYSGTGEGWSRAKNIMQSAGITLPVPGTDARVMVGFSDMAGSGQQHLVEVRATGVRYWPNAGHGRFDAPVSLPGFSCPAETFSPERLYLADVDGSGTTDLIYALSDHLLLWCNQSGNRFAEPVRVSLPEGVRYDRHCTLQVADIQGLGVASLVLSVPHPTPRHWVCHLTQQKPLLLCGMNNNMGAVHTWHYRSSAQFWLDEKAGRVREGKPVPPCYLPFALHTLYRTTVTDDISGSRLTHTVRYRHGAWDGREREFRGFGFVEVSDTEISAGEGENSDICMPAVNRSWYATGLQAVDSRLQEEYWAGDVAAPPGYTPRFTTGSGDDEQACTPGDETMFWLHRGMKGQLLRSELYGRDGSDRADIPYSVTENRPQVRLAERRGDYPVVWPATAESRTLVYERIISDPQCSQQMLLASNQYGMPLRQASISHPRRTTPDAGDYPDTLPENLLAASLDGQQQNLRLTLTQQSWHSVLDVEQGYWLPGLADTTRSDVLTLPAGSPLPLTLENRGLPDDMSSFVFAGQTRVWYLGPEGEETARAPAFPPRVAFTETAELDNTMVAALSQDITPEVLTQAGYHQAKYRFPRGEETADVLWVTRQGYTTYGTKEHFWLPQAHRETLLTGKTYVTRSAYDCVITRTQDAAGLTTTAEYDWRSLTPVCTTDACDNIHVITLDALGRVTSLRFSGTENGKPAGYSDTRFTAPENAETALALTAPLPVHQCMTYVADSWQRDEADRLPPHVVMLSTDRFDDDPEQQIRQQVVFSDGFGRVLQTSVRYEAGPAWQRTPEGGLKPGPDNAPVVAQTDFRWVVSGRTDYDNKGQAIRTYQPCFLNNWRYVRDDSARQDLHADTHMYDPVGRVIQVITAKGWQRRVLFTPWFVVSDDENDLAT